MKPKTFWRTFSLWVLIFILAACNQASVDQPTSPPESPTVELTHTPAPTPVPSMIFLDGSESTEIATTLQAWAADQGWMLERRGAQEWEGWSETPGLEAVVEIATGLTGDELTAAAPGVPVVTVDHASAIPGDNFSTVGLPNMRHDQAGFLAGALCGLASQSWVVTAVSNGGEFDNVYYAAFEHGLKYTCPRCWSELLAAWQVTTEALQSRPVDVVFVIPSSGELPSWPAILSTQTWIVHVGEAPQGVPAERIAGSVITDPIPILLAALDGLRAGESGTAWSYAIENGSLLWGTLNADAVSPGRVRILEDVWQALASGELDVGVDPQTGVER
ncbi:MAG TPA: hypothetical protein G4O08_02910 [Anaerolineae bacterium]|nr:hypothetical protein [Anaerolineae bacterium]